MVNSIFLDPTTVPFVAAFLFVFAIVFGALSYVDLFGGQRKINAVIAVAFGIFAVMYEPLVFALQSILPIAAIGLVIIFFVLFLKKAFGGGDKTDTTPIVISLAISLLLLGVFWDEIGFSLPGVDSMSVLWLILITVVALIFYIAYKQGTS